MKTLAAPALLLAAALAGCESTVNLPEPPHTPRVALLYTLTTAPQDSSFRALYAQRQLYVSNSQRVFDPSELTGRTDAAVELRDATGSVVERYRPTRSSNASSTGRGYYRPVLGFQPQAGQRYTLRAALPGLETAESSLVMPAPAVIESATYVARTAPNPGSNQYQGRLSVVLRDDPASTDYYLAFARVLDQQGQPGEWGAVDVDYDSQGSVVSIGQFQLSSPGQQYSLYPFADTGVNGQRIALASDVSFYRNCFQGQGNCAAPGYIEVYVSSITPDAYAFYLSRRRYYDSDDNPFAEPAPLATNVRPGYGLFGGAADATFRIRIF
ncbi:DUF4249 domain-containing protein [Hymenobacter sp.]|uniref:DUF4249 domain-containing protein n=1 Tax=Hymenobacter sp. TaxID=1898978 RepID=UPI00286A5E42|nr:DUF4249 domain-containing protein [Hymenobacter sp.]